MKGKIAADIDSYIKGFPVSTQKILQQVRETVRKAAPGAVEAIKYAMPTFVLHGNLVHFAGYENHIGFYPTPDGTTVFKEALSKYKTGKGSVQFPIDEPMPLALITAMVKHRVKTSTETASAKKVFAAAKKPVKKAAVKKGAGKKATAKKAANKTVAASAVAFKKKK